MHKMLLLTIEAIMVRRRARDNLKLPLLTKSEIEVDLDDKKPIDYWGNREEEIFNPRTEYETQDRIRHLVVKGKPKYKPSKNEKLKNSHLRARQNSTHWAAHRAYLEDKGTTFDPAWEAEMQTNNNWESAKIGALIRSIKKDLDQPLVKVLVFDSFIPNIKLIGYGLKANNIDFVEIHSKRTDRQRNEDIDRFRARDGPRVLVATEKSLNAGVNLQRASIVYLMTPSYTPELESQCIGRSHRMGQERDVFVYRLIAKESLDKHVKKVFQKHKRAQGRRLVEGSMRSVDLRAEQHLRRIDQVTFNAMLRVGFPELLSMKQIEEADDVDFDEYDYGEDDEEDDGLAGIAERDLNDDNFDTEEDE